MRQVVFIQRARRFSPNSVGNDYAILKAVEWEADKAGFQTRWIVEDNWKEDDFLLTPKDIVFTMARSRSLLAFLKKLEKAGVRVVNSTAGIEACSRSRLFKLLEENNIPVPARSGKNGYWLKRGDEAAQSSDDVVFCNDDNELAAAERRFAERGITDKVVQAHIVGDLVKFYGVRGAGFFRMFYPNDDGISKFGNESHNGVSHHYDFDVDTFHADAERISRLTDVSVYGGDAIITEQGKWQFIDFNDWPSFSRCREDAAVAIAGAFLN